MLYSEVSNKNVVAITRKDLFKKKDQLSQKFTENYDPKFWKTETIIPFSERLPKELRGK